MRFLLKLLAVVIFGPILLLLAALIVIAAIVGIPLAWEILVARLTAPPSRLDPGEPQPPA